MDPEVCLPKVVVVETKSGLRGHEVWLPTLAANVLVEP
jgi:hypothetical protein